MKRKSLYIIQLTIILVLLTGTRLHAQDIHFSQFYEAPLLRNPALAGLFTGDYRIQTINRQQWSGFSRGFRTNSLSGEYKMPIGKSNDFITAGLQLFADDAGTVRLLNAQMHPTVNYHKSLSNDRPMYLSLGITGGIIRKTISLNRITTDNQWVGGFDPSRPIGEEALVPQFFAIDAGVGLSYNSNFGNREKNMFFIGAALHHLNKPRNTFYAANNMELPRKTVASVGIRFGVDEYTSFVIQADHISQGGAQEIMGGALYSYALGDSPDNPEYIVSGGVFVRWKDAIVPVIKMQRRQLSLGLSYDVNISPLRATSRGRGGFELSLSYIGFVKKMSSSQEKVICPKF